MSKLSIPKKNLIIIGSILLILVLILTFLIVKPFSNSKTVENISQSSKNSKSSNSSQNSANSTNSISNSANSTSNSANSSLSSILSGEMVNSTNSNSTKSEIKAENSIGNSQNNQTNSQIKVENQTQNSALKTENVPNNSIKSYTNPSYPNLKINYDDSWKIERQSISRENGINLSDGIITLTKNNTKLTFKLWSSGAVRGTGFGPTELEKFNIGKTDRVKLQNIPGDSNSPIFYQYLPYSTKIKTNIKYNPSEHVGGMANNGRSSLLEMCKESPTDCDVKNDLLLFTLENKLESTNPSEIAEADQIIKNSILE